MWRIEVTRFAHDGTDLALINPLPRVSSTITVKFLDILDKGQQVNKIFNSFYANII